MPEFLRRKLGDPTRSYRFDMCRYGAPWRKRTRIATDPELAGRRELCGGGHSHQRLRGRSLVHKASWTRVAQVYPKSLCQDLASAMALKAGLISSKQVRLNTGGCAKSAEHRIGEAAHPGPRVRHAAEPHREARELVNTKPVEGTTVHLQDKVWLRFVRWLCDHLSPETCNQLFLCATLLLSTMGFTFLLQERVYMNFDTYLVLVKQQKPELKIHLTHGGCCSKLLCWKMRRWAATLMLGFLGMTRIGEAQTACRCDLLLPSDNFDNTVNSAFLNVQKPKTRGRGKGRIQHAKLKHSEEIQFFERHLSQLDPGVKIFPLSPAALAGKRFWKP